MPMIYSNGLANKLVAANDGGGDGLLHNPNAPCIERHQHSNTQFAEYLPAFTPKMTQM